jgi:rRNA maturation endonuclease Nob1
MRLFKRKTPPAPVPRCPECGERVPAEVEECAMCGRDLSAGPASEPPAANNRSTSGG